MSAYVTASQLMVVCALASSALHGSTILDRIKNFWIEVPNWLSNAPFSLDPH